MRRVAYLGSGLLLLTMPGGGFPLFLLGVEQFGQSLDCWGFRGLTLEEVLGQFGQRRGAAQQKYREYVREGIGGAPIWEGLEAQSLLGLEGFVVALRDHVSGKAIRDSEGAQADGGERVWPSRL
jgi:hypothetical protein